MNIGVLENYCKDIAEWPKSWMIVDEDIEYGEKVMKVFIPFLIDIVKKGYLRRTVKNHIDNIWLLGGEVIDRINWDETLRYKNADVVIRNMVDSEGGPYSKHLYTDSERRSFDSTCRKLHKYLEQHANKIEI